MKLAFENLQVIHVADLLRVIHQVSPVRCDGSLIYIFLRILSLGLWSRVS